MGFSDSNSLPVEVAGVPKIEMDAGVVRNRGILLGNARKSYNIIVAECMDKWFNK